MNFNKEVLITLSSFLFFGCMNFYNPFFSMYDEAGQSDQSNSANIVASVSSSVPSSSQSSQSSSSQSLQSSSQSSFSAASLGANPLFTSFYTTDAHPVVYNDRLYISCGQDDTNATGFETYHWRLLSTDDMSTWTDHGIIASPGDYGWTNWYGQSVDDMAWATSLVPYNGNFYLYASTDYEIWVLESTTDITGPYVDVLGGTPLIDKNISGDSILRSIDPVFFEDDDNTKYIFYGGDGSSRYVILNNDMISLSGGAVSVSDSDLEGTSGYNYLGASFVFKTNSTYFYLYCTSGWPSRVLYATASSVTGPWSYKGLVGAITGDGTNHPGVVNYLGEWWYTYHIEDGNLYRRRVCVDRLTITDSTIDPVVYTASGVP